MVSTLNYFNMQRDGDDRDNHLILAVHSNLGEGLALTISGMGICICNLDIKRKGDPS